jgi:hypothetical protein
LYQIYPTCEIHEKEGDDKEEPIMHDEILKGNGCPHRLNVDL